MMKATKHPGDQSSRYNERNSVQYFLKTDIFVLKTVANLHCCWYRQ